MEGRKASWTAVGSALVRARHFVYGSPPKVFEDSFAPVLLPQPLRAIVRIRPLFSAIHYLAFRRLGPGEAIVLSRSRYAEDKLREARALGIRQYVILGAGFDSFALRDREVESSLRVFELDHPATQEVKRKRLIELGAYPNSRLSLVPIDFQRERISSALARTSFDSSAPAFFSWTGVVPYLVEESLAEALSSIADCSVAGSELVLDYWLPHELVRPEDLSYVRYIENQASRLGEPISVHLTPDRLADLGRSLGFQVLEDLSADDQAVRYFRAKPDGLRPPSVSRLAHLRRKEC